MQVAQRQVIEGTSEEITALLQQGAFAGQTLCVIVEPENTQDFAAELPPPSDTVRDHAHLLELLQEGRQGPFHPVTEESWEQRRQEIHRRHAALQQP